VDVLQSVEQHDEQGGTRPVVNRSAGVWFGLSGLTALAGFGLYEFADPTYYDASSFVDYLSVVMLSGFFVATGIALVLLWRDPPVARGSLFLLFAGIGAAAEGLGNLLEDAFDVGVAVWAFFGGGIVMMLSLLIAGIVALTVDSPRRWSGLFLLFSVPGAMLGFGIVMTGVSWILFGLWIVLGHRGLVIALAAAAPAALFTAMVLYL